MVWEKDDGTWTMRMTVKRERWIQDIIRLGVCLDEC